MQTTFLNVEREGNRLGCTSFKLTNHRHTTIIMREILGYGEDALTLWVLKNRLEQILKAFNDNTNPEDCLVYYRPSFGRRGGQNSVEFGEFDAIIASREKYYLIESKWDNHSDSEKDNVILRNEQLLRHDIFTWYLFNWTSKYSGHWQKFKAEQENDFKKFSKAIPPAGSLLAANLESILSRLVDYLHCESIQSPVRNLLLFFYDGNRSKPPTKTNAGFTIIPIDYGKLSKDNFINI